MLNTIVGIFLGMNLVFMECVIAYGLIKKSKVKRFNGTIKK